MNFKKRFKKIEQVLYKRQKPQYMNLWEKIDMYTKYYEEHPEAWDDDPRLAKYNDVINEVLAEQE